MWLLGTCLLLFIFHENSSTKYGLTDGATNSNFEEMDLDYYSPVVLNYKR